MRRTIGQAFANDAFERTIRALHVINAQPDPVAVAKIKLGKIAVQVFFLAMLVNAFHAALEDRIVAFDRVAVNDRTVFRVADVFASGVPHRVMRRKVLADRV